MGGIWPAGRRLAPLSLMFNFRSWNQSQYSHIQKLVHDQDRLVLCISYMVNHKMFTELCTNCFCLHVVLLAAWHLCLFSVQNVNHGSSSRPSLIQIDGKPPWSGEYWLHHDAGQFQGSGLLHVSSLNIPFNHPSPIRSALYDKFLDDVKLIR